MSECKNIKRLSLLLLASIALLLVLINNNYSLKDYRYYTATAQEQKTLKFLITLVQNKPTTGEVAVVVTVGDEISTQKRDIDDKKVLVPVSVGTFSENIKDLDANVCVTILSSGEQACKTISNIKENEVNKLTINLRQVECNTQYCLNNK
jgi:hypothetical protein